MKRWIALLLAGILLFSTGMAAAEEPEGTEEISFEEENPESEEEEDIWINPYPDRDYEELVVGNPTPMDGKFFTGMWGNATSDIDVRSLVHGYYLTTWGYEESIFRKSNHVVSGMIISDDPEGNRTYTMALYDDLYFSDGTKITAWDYAFAVLFQAAPEIAETGGLPMELSYLKGYEEYYSGEAKAFEGVHVIDDSVIEFTVKHEYLPYFFELYRLCFCPFPIHEIAPGCKVYDDGEGCYIGNEDLTVEEKIFTVDLIRETVMDPDFGYLSNPTVGSGPYVLTGWDGVTCTFEINPYFKGDEEGHIPTIPKLRYTLARNEDMVELLQEDEFQLLNKVTRQDSIMKGIQLVGAGLGYTMSTYPRIGLTFIVFTPDRPALQEQNVRKAINYCFEKEETVEEYTAGYGMPMDGLIGLGQWMYSYVNGSNQNYPVEELPENPTAQEQAEYDEAIAAWEALSLDGLKHYELNVEKAVELLEENGWTLNKQGKEFRPGTDEYRCKEIDGQLVALDLKCAYPETNYTATSLLTLFIPHLAEAGIKLTLVPLDMKTLLRSYNDKDIEDIDLFYLGDDFNVEFDPQLFFQPGDPDAPYEDTMAWVHAQMYEYAHLMCETEPHDALAFVQKWITFQEKLSDMLPMIPVYTNVYFDFYTSDLTNYNILKYITWGDAIVPASYYNVGQAMLDMEAAEAAAAEAEGEAIFDD